LAILAKTVLRVGDCVMQECLFGTFVGGSSHVSSGLAKNTLQSQAENITEPSASDDSFFNTWLASPSQQQEASQSQSASKSSLASKHQSSKHVSSAGLKESKSLSGTFHGVQLSPESKLHGVSSAEQSFEIKAGHTSTAHSQLQPISVCISGGSETKPGNADVAGLLISTAVVGRSSSGYDERNFDESVPADKDVGKNDEQGTTVALLVSEASTGSDNGVVSSPDPILDTSVLLGHSNSQMSSSILSPEPDDLLGTDGDIQLESGWKDATVTDSMWLSSTVDLRETDDGDVVLGDVRVQLADQLDNSDVSFRCDEPSDVVDSVNESGHGSDRGEVSSNIAEDVLNALSAEVDVKATKEISLLQGVLKEISSLEGSLEASADELSESNKTVVAEDSDLYCDDTDVDEMQLSGSARSDNQQDHSVNILSSELCDSHADGNATVDVEHGISSGTDVAGLLVPATQLDEDSEACGTSPPSSTCVKNLLEEAMADNSTRDGTSSAEPARVESGGNSGHTSADEIDTTTSSDIEIISHASSVNGRPAGAHGLRPVDISPSRNSRMMSGQLHRRSDSGSSAQSLQSRTDDEFASPDTDHSRDYLTRPSRAHLAKSDPGLY